MTPVLFASGRRRTSADAVHHAVPLSAPLPRHRRVSAPPRMRLTRRDMHVLLAVRDYRVLRRDQVQRLLFPSKNTANERLKRLYQHGFLQRRWRPVEYGQGMSQALYLLDGRGAEMLAQSSGTDREEIRWRASHNLVSSSFLEHALMFNDVHIAVTLATRRSDVRISRWLGEQALSAEPDHVRIPSLSRPVAVIPDGYFVLEEGDRRAHFFLEADRATLSNKRWGRRIRAYAAYVHSGQYARRYATRSLRILTVTTGPKRLANLKATTEGVGGGELFWFATQDTVKTNTALFAPIWQIAGRDGEHPLLGGWES